MYLKISILSAFLMFSLMDIHSKSNLDSGVADKEVPSVKSMNPALTAHIGALIKNKQRTERTFTNYLKIEGMPHKAKLNKALAATRNSKKKLIAIQSKASKLKLSSRSYRALLAEAQKSNASSQGFIADIVGGIIDWWTGPAPAPPIPPLPTLPPKPKPPESDCQSVGDAIVADCMAAIDILSDCGLMDPSEKVMGQSTCNIDGNIAQMTCMVTQFTGGNFQEYDNNMAESAMGMCQAIESIVFQEQKRKETADGN